MKRLLGVVFFCVVAAGLLQLFVVQPKIRRDQILAERASASAEAHSSGADINTSHWKTFVSQGGWSIRYPPTWEFASCHACTDPTERGVFVTFDDPKSADDGILVEPLAGKSPAESTDAWFNDVKTTANQNRILGESRTILDDLPALKVTYLYADGTQGDVVFVAHGVDGFQITGASNHGLERPTCFRMMSTLRFSQADK